MGIKTIIFTVLCAAVMYKVFFLVRVMKIQETVYNHQPGPCHLVHIRNESCANVHASDGDCNDWAARGECTNNQAWMYEHCAHSCHQCEDRNQPLLGSEDFADVGNGKFLVSSGLRFLVDHFPDRKGTVYLFDFNKPNDGVQKTKLIWNQEKVDGLNPHGISSYRTKSGKVLVFLVNHDGEAIERFEYSAEDNTLTHLETITDPAFKFLNSVQPTGERSFYVTNFGSSANRFLFNLAGYTGMRFGDAVYFDGEAGRVVASGFYLPNGIRLSLDKRYLYLGHMGDMTLETYAIQEDFSLQQVHVLELYKSIDNIQLDAGTGDLWLGIVACPWQSNMYGDDPANPNLRAPAQALRVRTQDGIPTFDITDVYTNKGDVIRASTVAVYFNNQLVVGSLYDTTVYCKILHS